MSKQTPPAPTASTVGPGPTIKLYLIVCMNLAITSLYEGHKNGIEAEVSATARPQHISVSS